LAAILSEASCRMPAVDRRALLCFIIAHLWKLFDLLDEPRKHHPPRYQYERIGNLPARDVFGDLFNCGLFPPWVQSNRIMFQHIHDELLALDENDVRQARNVQFKHTAQENLDRRRVPCKISDTNRIVNFLHVMAEAPKVWSSAASNGWNPSSQSRDFRHILYHFVQKFGPIWIRPLNNAEKVSLQGSFYGYPSATQIIDGCMFQRRITKNLDPRFRKIDYFDHKHNHGESLNVQIVATQSGVITHALLGVPGAMHDTNASQYIALNAWNQSIMADDGYPAADPRFIVPDGSALHKEQRVPIEWVNGDIKRASNLVGYIYRNSSMWHEYAIYAALILHNMRKYFGPTHRRLDD